MTDDNHLSIQIHKIYLALTENQPIPQPNDLKQKTNSKKLDASLYQKMKEHWLMAKNRIKSIIKSLQNAGRTFKINLGEKQVLRQLLSTLGSFNGQMAQLLNQGILNLYIQLLNLREKALTNQVNDIIHNLLQDIIQAMSKLLFSYFCYQEYKNRTEIQPRKRTTSIFSLRNIGTASQQPKQEQDFDFKLMKDIEQNMKKKSIHQIINQHMQKEMAKITKEASLCKICSQKIKLRNIQRHVKLCQKQFDLKQDCQAKKRKISELTNKMRKKLCQINLKSQKSKEDQSLKTIITSLLYKQNSKKQKGYSRRSQSFIVSNNPNEHEYFVFLVEEHEQQYGKHETLSQICRIEEELILIERNINGCQAAIINLSKNNFTTQELDREQNSQSHNSKSINSLQINCESSGSQLNQKPVKKNVGFNISETSSKQDEKENKYRNKSMKEWLFQESKLLKKAESRKNLKEKSLHDLGKEKNYVSLQEITLCEQIDKKISLNDFQVLKLIGKGAYGKVYMVRRKQTQDVYALKIIHLSDNVTERQLQLIGKEHQIYKKIAGDYLVKAPFSFTQKSSHMFVLEYMCGGDLRKLLNEQVYFQQSAAKFYLAQIILAIQHLHKFNIIHRDLKPQNIVLDKDGHLKLTDFGLSELRIETMLKQTKKLNQNPSNIRRTSKRRAVFRYGQNKTNLIGTPDYIAPEIINYVSTSNLTIDWWSLGVIAYELIIGTRPFCADTIEAVIKNIKEFNIEWPEIGDQEGMISYQAKDLIQSLLNKDFMNRLGANGANEIKAHPFFQGINWEQIKRSNPPFKPDSQKTRKQFQAAQDKVLREEIEKNILFGASKSHSRLKLEKFVRFDLLGTETMENVEKIFNQKVNHISKLKTLQKLQKCNSFDDCQY